MYKLVALAGVLVALNFASNTPAQAQEQQSLKSILGKGYDIRSVTFAHGESTDDRDAVFVTLQKEKSVAVCYFAARTWINLTANFLDDSKRCEVR